MKKFFLIQLLLLPSLLFGQIDRSIRPVAKAAPVINIKDPEVFTLPNGITVILSENHKLPRVSFDLVMSSDPVIEGEKAGISEMASSLILNGTSNRTKDQLDAEIDFIGANLSATENSITMSCLSKHMEKGLDLMLDVLMNANFPEDEFERVKNLLSSELANTKSDPNEMAANAEFKVNFSNHPYGNVMSEKTLNSITREDVIAYYKSNFTPKNSHLVVVGDITKEKVNDIVSNYFLNWKGENPIVNELNNSNLKQGNRVFFIKKQGAVQSVVKVTFPINIKTGDQDQIPLTVMNSILGGSGFGTRLMQNLREDKAYTYGCYSNLNITENGSWVSIGGNFRNEVTDSAITQILFEIEQISNNVVKTEELELTKSTMFGSFSRSLERPQTIARFALNIIKNNLDKDYYKNYLKRLESVSVDDILNMSKKYFTYNNCNIIVVGNEDILDKLKPFDSDGKIELLDAFGEPVKEMIPATITADELVSNYILAVTNSKNLKESNKKLKKIKSIHQKTELSMNQFPFPISMNELWVTPNKIGRKLEAQEIVFEQFYFDGVTGQRGGQGKKEDLSAENINSYAKSVGFFPEINYKNQGIIMELLGIETLGDKTYYVLKSNNGEAEKFDYFSTKDYLKYQTIEIEKNGEESIASTTIYNDFKAVNGLILPHSKSISGGGMTLSGGTVYTINGNEKLDNYKMK
jgi:predicted Zn-dependent peptidase